MVKFAKRRFQVFVSSTYTDLLRERQAAVEAIRSAGHIPAGMELFAAGDESQMEVIRQWIDESDVYLLILGGRYGSIEPKSGKSYVQLEYEYALERKKPLFSCVIKENVLDRRLKKLGKARTDVDGEKLQAFRALVLTRTVEFWDDHKDIGYAVLKTLNDFSRREDIGGWVRQNEGANLPALADEIVKPGKEARHIGSVVHTSPPRDESAILSAQDFSKYCHQIPGWKFYMGIDKAEMDFQQEVNKLGNKILKDDKGGGLKDVTAAKLILNQLARLGEKPTQDRRIRHAEYEVLRSQYEDLCSLVVSAKGFSEYCHQVPGWKFHKACDEAEMDFQQEVVKLGNTILKDNRDGGLQDVTAAKLILNQLARLLEKPTQDNRIRHAEYEMLRSQFEDIRSIA